MTIEILCIAGARPNFIKIAPIISQLKKSRYFHDKFALVHTGQHSDFLMSKAFFEDLNIPQPDFFLNIGKCDIDSQFSRIIDRLGNILARIKPKLVLTVGDVNSTLASAITANNKFIPIAHVEAGLRSFDDTMIEERNRKLTDAMSSLLFTHCKEADKNLLDEGIHKSKIYRVGNIMIDSLKVSMRLAQKRESILDRLDIQKREYAVLTLHRPTNVDSIQELKKILQILMSVSPKLPIVFPVHPRTAKSLTMLLKTSEISYRTLSAKIYDKPIVSINDTSKATCPWHGLLLAPPLRYLDFLNLMMNSKLVLTDSGGIQEETTYLKIPCLTLRENTERPVTVSKGTNILVGKDKDKIASNVNKIMEGKEKKGEIPKLWDGKASRRIVRVLYNWL